MENCSMPDNGKMDALPARMDTVNRLPVRFHRDSRALARSEPHRGIMPSKLPRAYYLDGLGAIFQPDIALPGVLGVEENFSGAEVALLYPGPNAVEVLGIVERFPELQYLHIIESSERNIEAIRLEIRSEEHTSELQSQFHLVCRLLLEKKKNKKLTSHI